jgi:hypothetical protein
VQQTFLIAWLLGILVLVAGLFVTRLNWRSDIAPYGRHSPTFDIVFHPEKYAHPESLAKIRALTWLGLALLLIGLGALIGEAAR